MILYQYIIIKYQIHFYSIIPLVQRTYNFSPMSQRLNYKICITQIKFLSPEIRVGRNPAGMEGVHPLCDGAKRLLFKGGSLRGRADL